MNNLRFDAEGARERLTQVFRDRISAQGAVDGLQNVDINDVAFADLETDIAGHDQLIAEMQADLRQAQSDARRWFNEAQPHLTAIPQAVINYATLWNRVIPLVLAQLSQREPDRVQLQQLFAALGDSIDRNVSALNVLVASLEAIRTAVADDAASFSAGHAPFGRLENLDSENITAGRTTLARLSMLLADLDQRIGVGTLDAESDLAIATAAMKAGQKGGNIGSVAGLTVGLLFIVSAVFAIDDLMTEIDDRLAVAQQSADFQLNLSPLSAQFLALDTASSALSALDEELGDMITSAQTTIGDWQKNGRAIASILADLAGNVPISAILNQFDIGQTQAQWDELSTFAYQCQTMEVSVKAIAVPVGAPFNPADLGTLGATIPNNLHTFKSRRTSC